MDFNIGLVYARRFANGVSAVCTSTLVYGMLGMALCGWTLTLVYWMHDASGLSAGCTSTLVYGVWVWGLALVPVDFNKGFRKARSEWPWCGVYLNTGLRKA